MMRVLIIGASKGIGLETTRQALASGPLARAQARSAAGMTLSNPKLEKVRGDALKTEGVEAAMTAKGVKRLISVTGFGAGDSGASIHVPRRAPFRIAFGRAYEDESLQVRLIKESALDWAIARPGVLTVGPRTGRYESLAEPSQWRNGILSPSDVADFLVRRIEDRTFVRQAPVLVN